MIVLDMGELRMRVFGNCGQRKLIVKYVKNLLILLWDLHKNIPQNSNLCISCEKSFETLAFRLLNRYNTTCCG